MTTSGLSAVSLRALALLSLSLTLSGCFFQRNHVNQPIEPARLAQLEPGVSTASDVVAALGAPTDVVQLGRRSAYRYDHRVEKQTGLFLLVLGLRGIDSNSDRVWVFLDEDDILTHVGATLEASEASYGIPVFQDPD